MCVYSQVLRKLLLWSWAEFALMKKKGGNFQLKLRVKFLLVEFLLTFDSWNWPQDSRSLSTSSMSPVDIKALASLVDRLRSLSLDPDCFCSIRLSIGWTKPQSHLVKDLRRRKEETSLSSPWQHSSQPLQCCLSKHRGIFIKEKLYAYYQL